MKLTRYLLGICLLVFSIQGSAFDEMDMKLEAIASMTGMSGIFKLMGADVYKVISIRPIGA